MGLEQLAAAAYGQYRIVAGSHRDYEDLPERERKSWIEYAFFLLAAEQNEITERTQ